MKTKVATSLFVAAAILGTFSRSAMATDPATAGTTSTGSSTLTLTVPPLVKITGIADLTMSASYTGSGALDQVDDVCVYSNMDTDAAEVHTYLVDMTGNGTGTTFTLTCQSGSDCFDAGAGGTPDQISYLPYWNDVAGTNTGEASGGTRGGASAQITGQNGWANTTNCGGGTNARFHVNIQETDILNNRRTGTYQGVLTILITPNP